MAREQSGRNLDIGGVLRNEWFPALLRGAGAQNIDARLVRRGPLHRTHLLAFVVSGNRIGIMTPNFPP